MQPILCLNKIKNDLSFRRNVSFEYQSKYVCCILFSHVFFITIDIWLKFQNKQALINYTLIAKDLRFFLANGQLSFF